MTARGGTPKEAKPIILRQLCERFTHPFDHMEVYKKQLELDDRLDKLSEDEIKNLLPQLDCLRVVEPGSHNKRTKYEFKGECRLPEQVSIAVSQRQCARCGRDIHRGERIFDPRPRSPGDSARKRAYCRECGLVELRDQYLALEGRPRPTRARRAGEDEPPGP